MPRLHHYEAGFVAATEFWHCPIEAKPSVANSDNTAHEEKAGKWFFITPREA